MEEGYEVSHPHNGRDRLAVSFQSLDTSLSSERAFDSCTLAVGPSVFQKQSERAEPQHGPRRLLPKSCACLFVLLVFDVRIQRVAATREGARGGDTRPYLALPGRLCPGAGRGSGRGCMPTSRARGRARTALRSTALFAPNLQKGSEMGRDAPGRSRSLDTMYSGRSPASRPSPCTRAASASLVPEDQYPVAHAMSKNDAVRIGRWFVDCYLPSP